MELPTRLKTGSSKPKPRETAADSAKRMAQDAVDQCQEMISTLREAEKSFRDEFPEAHEAIERLNEYKDDISEHIDRTKLLVRTAGVSIGDFKVTKKKSQASYDPALSCKCLGVAVDRAASELNCLDDAHNDGDGVSWDQAHDHMKGVYVLTIHLKEMMDAGVLSTLPFDKDNAKLFFPANPAIAEIYVDAWDEGGKELTPAVKVPKL